MWLIGHLLRKMTVFSKLTYGAGHESFDEILRSKFTQKNWLFITLIDSLYRQESVEKI